jgi:nitroreductase
MPENMSNSEKSGPAAARGQDLPAPSIGTVAALKRRVWATLGYLTFVRGLVRVYRYDIRRYYRAASKGNEAVRSGRSRYTELHSWIAADAHKIEKGLALAEPRPGFGAPVVKRLIEQVERFHRDFGPEQVTLIAVNALKTYCDFNEQHGHGNETLRRKVERLSAGLGDNGPCNTGGTMTVTRDAILKSSQLPGLADFFQCRHSVRMFTDEPVSMELVEAAVRMAQRTPSVCNRQSWKAYAFVDREIAHKVLACQQGNRGFGDRAGGVVVITSDLQTFFSYGERNQGFIDGGMFAMSVTYGLHAQGLGTCCLNWCVDVESERKLRALTTIPDHEAVIMMIAIGHLPEEFIVAQSVRKPLDQVCIAGQLRGSGTAQA